MGIQEVPATKVKKRRSLLWSEARDGYLFILPWVFGFIIFTAGPMLASLYISFTRWEIVTPSVWVGGAQYVKLFNDDRFWLSLYNTSYYVFVGVPLHLFFALLAALAVNMNLRGIHFFRTAYYVPSLTPVVANSILWVWIFHPDWGLANAFLEWIGLEGLYWLQDPRLAKPALIVMSFWSIGGQMVILAGRAEGDPDGAVRGRGHRRRQLVEPVLARHAAAADPCTVLQPHHRNHRCLPGLHAGLHHDRGRAELLDAFLSCSIFFRAAFENFRMGYASAMAWVLFIIVLTFTALQFMLSDRWVFYEGDVRR